jgi:hypothetical protein
MTLLTLIKFLFGDRESILRVARCPGALWIGLLFVLAAGLAREYDGEDLLHEPWHVLIPLAASLASSALLYLLISLAAWRRGGLPPSLFGGYRILLTLYWMTAPLALVYAIPFERFLTAGGATTANLWLLAIVAVWRVVLITRVISVLYSASYSTVLWLVLLFADSVTLIAITLVPKPIFALMGGIRLTESEQVIQGTTLLIFGLGFYSFPIWLLSALGVVIGKEPRWEYLGGDKSEAKVGRDVLIAAILALCSWALVLPFTQREQSLRYQVESALRRGDIDAALTMMSTRGRSAFPPHWDPPPRIAYREQVPDVVAVVEQLDSANAATWVREIFSEKYANWLRGHHFARRGRWPEMTVFELERHLAIVEKLPNRRQIIEDTGFGLSLHLEKVSESVRYRIERLLEEAGIARSDNLAQGAPAQENGEPKTHSDSP